MMAAVDKADAAALLHAARSSNPTGWIFLNFLMDPRTGLGRFRDFRISNYELMMELIDALHAACRSTRSSRRPT